MKPIIGIVGRPLLIDNEWTYMGVSDSCRNAVLKYDAVPLLIIPPQQIGYATTKYKECPILTDSDKEILTKYIDMCDGIILPGGYKMFEYDFFVLEQCIKKDIPVLGICMGMQIMANYGREVNNVPNDTPINHQELYLDYAHDVTINEDSFLYKIVRKKQIKVNSMHSLHVLPSNIYKVMACSDDGIIEAMEYSNNTFNIGVQWHPEKMFEYDESARRIFERFLAEIIKYRNERKGNIVKI